MKKTLWTVQVNNYAPEICKITFPFLERYAEKIGADFKVITERKFSEHSPTYEKLQIYELGKENDFNIFVDADCLIHPDFFDLTLFLKEDECFHINEDFSPIRFKPDPHFIKDGRFIGACNWFVISGKATHDLWRPTEQSIEEMHSMIYPTQAEKGIGCDKIHLQDDYTLSRNISKFNLKHLNLCQLRERNKMTGFYWWNTPSIQIQFGEFFWHDYVLSMEQKVLALKQKCIDWRLI